MFCSFFEKTENVMFLNVLWVIGCLNVMFINVLHFWSINVWTFCEHFVNIFSIASFKLARLAIILLSQASRAGFRSKGKTYSSFKAAWQYLTLEWVPFLPQRFDCPTRPRHLLGMMSCPLARRDSSTLGLQTPLASRECFAPIWVQISCDIHQHLRTAGSRLWSLSKNG